MAKGGEHTSGRPTYYFVTLASGSAVRGSPRMDKCVQDAATPRSGKGTTPMVQNEASKTEVVAAREPTI